jgi:DNA-binding PadR family transcriptional regulator
MRDATYYTLAVLLDGPSHGYAVLERVKEMTGGKVSLTTGTLYGTLDRLVDEGLIRRAGSEIVRGRARQYFEITDKGSGAVQLEAERLAQAAEAVQKAMRARAGRQKAGARRSAPGRTPAPGLPCRTPAIA